jgi:hypothetical protein
MSQLIENYFFIHNVFANFFKDTLDFFTCVYPRFEYQVIGTYEKSVEYINKQCQYQREIDKPLFPALILNPSGEFLPSDTNSGGKQLWRYPNLAPTLSKRLFDTIYKDQHIQIYPGFLRIKGDIELIILLNSFYEYCDLKILFLNMFGGLERIIYPKFFSSFIILPESFINYEYYNEYTNERYIIDWNSANASEQIVRTTARNELVIPVNIKPQYSLTSLSDGSERYGGTDDRAQWKLLATINYEIEIPNYLVIESNYLVENINININYNSVYSQYNDYNIPENKILYNFSWDWELNSNTNTPDKLGEMDSSDTTSSLIISDYIYKRRYFHIVSQTEIDSTSNIEITLPEQIIYPKIIIVNSKYGELKYGDNYIIKDDGWTLEIKTSETKTENINQCPPISITENYVYLEKGWILELYIYEKI